MVALASLAAAQTLACGKVAPEPEVSQTPVTSAAVAAPAPASADELSCSSPGADPSSPHLALQEISAAKSGTGGAAREKRARRALDKAIEGAAAETELATDAPTDPRGAEAQAQDLAPRAADNAARGSRVGFRSALPAPYALQRVQLLVDGAPAYYGRAEGGVQMTPGDHVVEVVTDYVVRDALQTYVGDDKMQLRSTQVIPATGAPVVFMVTAISRGGAGTPIKQRAALSWRTFPEEQAMR